MLPALVHDYHMLEKNMCLQHRLGAKIWGSTGYNKGQAQHRDNTWHFSVLSQRTRQWLQLSSNRYQLPRLRRHQDVKLQLGGAGEVQPWRLLMLWPRLGRRRSLPLSLRVSE